MNRDVFVRLVGGVVFSWGATRSLAEYLSDPGPVGEDEHPNDDQGHGTHVAGTIAQSTNNGLGVAGIAFGCSIMPVKVLDNTGTGTIFGVARGIYFAVENGASVINMSFGCRGDSQTLRDAVAAAFEQGVTCVCAAGNDGSFGSPPSYPAGYDEFCIGVASTRYDETRSWFSTSGGYVDVAAPGGDLGVDQNRDGFPDGVLQQTLSGGARQLRLCVPPGHLHGHPARHRAGGSADRAGRDAAGQDR